MIIKKTVKKMTNHRMLSNIFWTGYSLGPGKEKYKEFCEFADNYYNVPSIPMKRLFMEYKYYSNKYGASMVDFFLYRLYLKSEYEVSRYMTEQRRIELYDAADDKAYIHVMGDKKDFYHFYGEYMQKNVGFSMSDEDYEHFRDVCDGQDYIIIKPADGQRGMGVEKVWVGDDTSMCDVWEKCLKNHLVFERVLLNDASLREFHPCSLNTIRVSTVLDKKNNVHIMTAVLRTGTGSNVVDNGHSGGVYAAIDVMSGVICSYGYNSQGRSFIKHPDSGKIFLGYEIPCWKELTKLVSIIAKKEPHLRYIGWDFVLDENRNWVLLEGNEPGGIDVHQHTLGHGLYYQYKKYLV